MLLNNSAFLPSFLPWIEERGYGFDLSHYHVSPVRDGTVSLWFTALFPAPRTVPATQQVLAKHLLENKK